MSNINTVEADSAQVMETRRRLLEAAGEVFAEQGFRCATIREICSRAKANVAAVNYHFGDKQGLYNAVLKYAHECCCSKYPPDLGLDENAAPEDRLRAYVRAFLLRIFDSGRPAWYGKLEAQEMVEPTAALDMLVREQIMPRALLLQKILRSILGSDVDDRVLMDCYRSVVGQCVFYHHCKAVIMRVDPLQTYSPEDIARTAEHITRFSLAALHTMKPELQRSAASPVSAS